MVASGSNKGDCEMDLCVVRASPPPAMSMRINSHSMSHRLWSLGFPRGAAEKSGRLRYVPWLLALLMVAVSVGAAVDVEPAWGKTPTCTSNCPVPSGLKWKSPTSVSDGVPAVFRSVNRCPKTRPDGSPIEGTREVFVTIIFSSGAESRGPIAVRRNGKWAGSLTFNTSGLRVPSTHIEADCEDVTSVTGVSIASYAAHTVAVNQ